VRRGVGENIAESWLQQREGRPQWMDQIGTALGAQPET